MKRLLEVVFLAAIAGAGYLFYAVTKPYAGFQNDVILEFPKGTSTSQMAEMLRARGVVRESWLFLAARAARPRAILQAGEYHFTNPASALEVFNRIARGDVYFYEVTIPEGKNLFETAAIVGTSGVIAESKFLEAARDPASIRDLDPQAATLEGYLFPNTYRFDRHTSAQRLCALMTSRFRQSWTALHTDAPVHRTITLASLVEKEARVPGDRPLIASVFERRLKLGMKLDCDPTTIYAAVLEGRYRGVIHRSDLDSTNAYNTYRHVGLPPGPIASPGLDSIKSALQPADTDYLYFVLKPDGSGAHRFSASYKAHESATAQYRRAAKP